jgi:hypothetical protein
MQFSAKKIAAAVATGVLTVGLGAGAYAYFTAAGSGTGHASVGSASTISLTGTTTSAIYPGGPGADVSIVVLNPGSGAQKVGTVSLDSIDTPAGCDSAWFSMSPVTVDATLAAGAQSTVHGTLMMANPGANQNACQGAALTLHLSSN